MDPPFPDDSIECSICMESCDQALACCPRCGAALHHSFDPDEDQESTPGSEGEAPSQDAFSDSAFGDSVCLPKILQDLALQQIAAFADWGKKNPGMREAVEWILSRATEVQSSGRTVLALFDPRIVDRLMQLKKILLPRLTTANPKSIPCYFPSLGEVDQFFAALARGDRSASLADHCAEIGSRLWLSLELFVRDLPDEKAAVESNLLSHYLQNVRHQLGVEFKNQDILQALREIVASIRKENLSVSVQRQQRVVVSFILDHNVSGEVRWEIHSFLPASMERNSLPASALQQYKAFDELLPRLARVIAAKQDSFFLAPDLRSAALRLRIFPEFAAANRIAEELAFPHSNEGQSEGEELKPWEKRKLENLGKSINSNISRMMGLKPFAWTPFDIKPLRFFLPSGWISFLEANAQTIKELVLVMCKEGARYPKERDLLERFIGMIPIESRPNANTLRHSFRKYLQDNGLGRKSFQAAIRKKGDH